MLVPAAPVQAPHAQQLEIQQPEFDADSVDGSVAGVPIDDVDDIAEISVDWSAAGVPIDAIDAIGWSEAGVPFEDANQIEVDCCGVPLDDAQQWREGAHRQQGGAGCHQEDEEDDEDEEDSEGEDDDEYTGWLYDHLVATCGLPFFKEA